MISYNALLPNGDRPVVWLPSTYRTDGTGKPGVVCLPGTGTTWNAVYAPSVMLRIAQALTSAGFPCITSDIGVDEFGNPRARSGIDAAIAFAQRDGINVRPGPVHLHGFSQGGGSALSWAAANPQSVLSYTGVCPLVDLNILAETGGTSKTFLDNAYPPAYVEGTHGAENNPQTLADAGKFGSLPMTLCTSSNDAVIPAARVATFAATVGASATTVNLGPVGHDNSVPNLPASIAALLGRIGA